MSTAAAGSAKLPLGDEHPIVGFKEFLEIAVLLDPKRPLFLLGEPGSGKSAAGKELAETWAKKLGQPVGFHRLCGPGLQEFDLNGLPALSTDGQTTVFRPLELMYRLTTAYPDGGPEVLLIDDFTVTREEVQAIFYPVANEREHLGRSLRDNVRLIFTGNRTTDKAGAHDFNYALKDRGILFHMIPTSADWLTWAVANGVHPSVVGYIRSRPDKLHCFDANKPINEIATCRSWHILSDSMHRMEGHAVNIRPVVAGTVGRANSTDFMAWLKYYDRIIPPSEIVKDPLGVAVPPESEMDVLHATVSSLEFYLNENPKVWKPVLQYSLRIMPELAVIVARMVNHVILNKLSTSERERAMIDPLHIELREKYFNIM